MLTTLNISTAEISNKGYSVRSKHESVRTNVNKYAAMVLLLTNKFKVNRAFYNTP